MDEVWLFTIDEARELAQQHSSSGTRRAYWYIDEAIGALVRRQSEMSNYLLDARAGFLFLAANGETTGVEEKVSAGGGKRIF